MDIRGQVRNSHLSASKKKPLSQSTKYVKCLHQRTHLEWNFITL